MKHLWKQVQINLQMNNFLFPYALKQNSHIKHSPLYVPRWTMLYEWRIISKSPEVTANRFRAVTDGQRLECRHIFSRQINYRSAEAANIPAARGLRAVSVIKRYRSGREDHTRPSETTGGQSRPRRITLCQKTSLKQTAVNFSRLCFMCCSVSCFLK